MNSFHFPFVGMGCPCELHLEGCTESQAQKVAQAVLEEVSRLDRKYSHYRHDSLVARVAATAGSAESLSMDEETANLLEFAATLHEQTGGLFDVTAGALTRLWALQNGKIPSAREVADALQTVGWQRIEWQRPSLRLPIAGMGFDLGGIVKEYAADRAVTICRELGVSHGLVDLGGDLAVIGDHVDGNSWLVGIRSPGDRLSAVARIEIKRGGLATSGDYERATIVEGIRYSHILNPLTGYPIQSFSSVSVVADTCLIAGAAATVAMLMGTKTGLTWLENLGLPFLCIAQNGERVGSIASPNS